MSDGAPAVGRDEIWIEKYRPRTLDEVVGQDDITARLKRYVERNELPNLLFAGPAGVGKTASAVAIAREFYGEDWQENFLELNASDDRGIDVVRTKVKNFADKDWRGREMNKPSIIFLDEADSLCVPPGTEVVTGYPSKPEVKPIEKVAETGEPIPSVDFETNEIRSDEGRLVDSGTADFFEVELEDGREIVASPGHPFFMVGSDGQLVERELQDLEPGDEIADFRDEIGLSKCECCGAWTPGRCCSIDCKNEGHSHDMQGDGSPMHGTECSDARREEIVREPPDGRFAGENNPNDGGESHGVHVVEMDDETIAQFRQSMSDAEWWDTLEGEGKEAIRKTVPEEFDPAVVFDGGRRTVSTVEIASIEYSHRGKAYNITMDGTPNFVLANGILTHNTSDAQSALRRTMEQFSNNTRFVLSCNYSSQIIDPIQSRCAVFRFSPLADEAVGERIREIADVEGIDLTDDGVDALVYAADGDMRKAINALQAAAVMDGTVDEESVFTITATARPEEIREMVTHALDGDFAAARSVLDDLLTEKGLAGGDVIDQLHRSVWEFDLSDEAAVRLMDRIGEADYRIAEGANERVQLEALLAAVALEDG